MDKKKEKDLLYENIETTCDIYCSNCNEADSAHHIDEFGSAEYFQDKGWRATEYNTYCPKCAKKKLKSKLK